MPADAPLRIVFMGSPAVALPSLDFLQQSSHEIVGVITRPDRPAGRGRKVQPCAVAARARELGLSLFQPESLINPPFIETLRQLKPDLAIIVAYGKILKPDIIEAPRYRCWNVHFSLLPKYRGAAPCQWTLINGETRTGVTIIRLVEKMDAGPILGQVEMDIDPEDNTASLEQRLAVAGVELLERTLNALAAGTLSETPQDDSHATLAPLLKKEDGLIHWQDTADSISNRIRGLDPWPGAYTYLATEPGKGASAQKEASVDKVMLKIYSSRALAEETSAAPGTILKADTKAGFIVACGRGALQLQELQLQGKKRMTATDFLRGHRISEGTQL